MSAIGSEADAWYERGALAHRAGNRAGAESHFRKALSLDPGHGPARLWLGVVLRNDGNNVEAEGVLAGGAAQAEDPALKAALFYNLAFARYHQGRKDAAVADFAEAAKLDARLGADLNRADLLDELHRFAEVETVLKALLAREPGNARAHDVYNNFLHRMGRDEEFLKSFDAAPQIPELQIAKAGLLLKRGRKEEANILFGRVLANAPHSLEAALGAATSLNDMGRPAEAMTILEQAAKYHAKDPGLFQNLASTALTLRDPQKAAAMAEQSLRLSPVDQAGLAVLGSAWRMMGDERDEMLNAYDELIQSFDLEAPQGFSSMADFNHELNEWLGGMHANIREPLEQSLRGGSQTRGFMFGQGHDLVERLRARIEEAMRRYIAGIKPDARHPFRGRAGAGFSFKDSWSSRLQDCGFHINHIHRGGWISSCYYVALPKAVEDTEKKQGWIKFGEPTFDIGLGVRRAIQPVPGRLVLFPSYMWHGTYAFHENAARTTIAFDAVPSP